MADGSHIEWTDATWNPITGCSVISPGCANCYAMRLAGTRLKDHPSRAGLTAPSKAGAVWTGDVRFNEQWLNQPLKWWKRRRIFVCAHGDLFHERVPFGWVMRVLQIIHATPGHTYQVLTKRPDRMRAFFRAWADVQPIDWEFAGAQGPKAVRARHSSGRGQLFADMLESMGDPPPGCAYPMFDWANGMSRWEDVFENLWLGVSVEDQTRADERIPILLDTPAAVRWISAEPLLGPISFESSLGGTLWMGGQRGCGAAHFGVGTSECPVDEHHHHDDRCKHGLDWVVVGGESGPGARPMHPDWGRQIRDDCAAAGVPFFFKQWGEFAPTGEHLSEDRPEFLRLRTGQLTHVFDDLTAVAYVGKRRAGRLLDGRTHDAMPMAAA